MKTLNDYVQGATGHFTQVVWKATTKLGCGYNQGCGYIKCEYDVGGNMQGDFENNVQGS